MPSANQLTVERITVFPVKSCHYVELSECEVDNMGIKHDRRFMIINADTNRFVTQRKYSSLCLLRPSFDEAQNILTLNADGQEPLTLPLKQDLSKLERREVRLWKSALNVFDMGDEAAQWLSEFLRNHVEHDIRNNHNKDDPIREDDPIIPARLVTLDDPKNGVYSRPAHPKLNGAHSSFTDWSPISFGFSSSLKELNKGMVETGFSKGEEIPMIRFRNNITISGTLPWEEDEWLVVKVGGVTMYILQPLGRCSVPGIDQDTGNKKLWDGKGPIDYLKMTRKFAEEPNDGQFCCDVVPLTTGKIRVGDRVEVLERIPQEYRCGPLPRSAVLGEE
ncbi:Molybdenum cofactor sulfurase [Choanephora cucurbitarum]|uniref:Molybdenum cofactor sulfurase n=1 Tax=Choanephora cucurbitarum TaxID=101091 RepID=A0A1C7NN77_9FUNG|nr:Molybdenum cofactor sulfurase [Choanephora cucurbitarum]